MIAATALSAISGDVVLAVVLRSSLHAPAAELATNVAYPLGDLVLLGIVIGAITLNGWRLVTRADRRRAPRPRMITSATHRPPARLTCCRFMLLYPFRR